MTTPLPASGPVPDPPRPRGLRSRVIPAGVEWWNVTHDTYAGTPFNAGPFNDSGGGDARFSPLFDADGEPVPVLYVARHPIEAMLETVFHEVWAGHTKRVRRADLDGRVLRRLMFNTDVRVVDLGDAELDRHGLERSQIVSTSTEHYDRARAGADLLLGATVGGQPTAGIGWQSRMVELARASVSPLWQTALVGEQSDVAVVYQMPGGIENSEVTILSTAHLDTGPGFGLVVELANAVGAFVDSE